MSKPAATLQAAANPRLHGWTLWVASQGEEHQGALVRFGLDSDAGLVELFNSRNAALVETVAQAGATFRTMEGYTLDGAAVLRLVEAARSQGGLVL